MKFRFLGLLPFLLLFSLPPGVWGGADGRNEAGHANGEVRREINGGAGQAGVSAASNREEKRLFNSLWRQLSREEREALRRQMREAWQRLPPEERQRALAIAVERSEGKQGVGGRKGEQHYGMRGDDESESGQARQRQRGDVARRAYWESLSAEERAALRGNLREILRRRCQARDAEGKGTGAEATCGKGVHR
jgi:hypothetical protein